MGVAVLGVVGVELEVGERGGVAVLWLVGDWGGG